MAKTELTAQRLRELLDYDPATGVFVWRQSRMGQVKAGDVAGGVNSRIKYAQIGVQRTRYYAHRLVWLWVYGRFPTNEIDHINGNRSDNRLENLREVTTSQNGQNKHRAIRGSSSQFVGVSWDNKYRRWEACISVSGRKKFLGYFEREADAAAARAAAETRYYTHAPQRAFPHAMHSNPDNGAASA